MLFSCESIIFSNKSEIKGMAAHRHPHAGAISFTCADEWFMLSSSSSTILTWYCFSAADIFGADISIRATDRKAYLLASTLVATD